MKGIEKTTVIVSVISGVCVLLAAVIGLFNPIATKLADRILSVPTETPTITPLPTATPTFTATPRPTATPPPTSTPVPTRIPTLSPPPLGNGVQFILANNDTVAHSFYLDGFFATNISSGAVLVFDAPGGTHQLEDCPLGENPIANPTDCDSERYGLNQNPFDWTIGGDAKVGPKVSLILMNDVSSAQTIYIDGTLVSKLEPNSYYIKDIVPGVHSIQNCSGDIAPGQSGAQCNDPQNQDWERATEIWKIAG